MQIFYSAQDLFEHMSRLALTESTPVNDRIKQLTIAGTINV